MGLFQIIFSHLLSEFLSMDDPHSNKQMQTKEPKNGIHFLSLFYFAAGSVFLLLLIFQGRLVNGLHN